MVEHLRKTRASGRPRQGKTAHAHASASPTSTPNAAPVQPAPAPDPTRDAEPGERVAKALARAGVASRREVERLIGEGRVALNGRVLDTPAVKIAPSDILTVNGEVVAAAEPTRVWRYHKPAGLMTTHNDPQGRPTVFEALPKQMPRVISIGRLDLNSEGLLLLTNDGQLARALELPSNGWVRRYRARAFGRCDQALLDTLAAGMAVEGVAYGPIEARLDKVQHKSSPETGGKDLHGPANIWISLALSEGKNREVRRVLEALGLKVNRLIRLAYGPFALGTLEVGAVEEVGPRVIREQLVDHIAPQNLPTGARAAASVREPAPTRRAAPAPPARPGYGQPRTSSPARTRPSSTAHPREGGDPDGDRTGRSSGAPTRKSLNPRFRGDERKKEAAASPEKPVYKPGWAKPKRKPTAAVRPGANPEAQDAPGRSSEPKTGSAEPRRRAPRRTPRD